MSAAPSKRGEDRTYSMRFTELRCIVEVLTVRVMVRSRRYPRGLPARIKSVRGEKTERQRVIAMGDSFRAA